MTEPDQGLPTAARAMRHTDELGRAIMENPNLDEPLEKGDKLVRRSDVKALIRRKINTMHEVENNREEERAEKANRVRHQLEELLEELEGEASK